MQPTPGRSMVPTAGGFGPANWQYVGYPQPGYGLGAGVFTGQQRGFPPGYGPSLASTGAAMPATQLFTAFGSPGGNVGYPYQYGYPGAFLATRTANTDKARRLQRAPRRWPEVHPMEVLQAKGPGLILLVNLLLHLVIENGRHQMRC